MKTSTIRVLLRTLFLSFCTVTYGQTIIYDADFSTDGDGFADHTTSSPPASAPANVGPFGTVNNQWSLSYDTQPNTDGTANSFSVSGGALVSNDWGGQGIFQSESIDITGISTLNISALSTNIKANDNEFVYFYSLDGGPRVETANITSNDGDALNYTISNLNVSGNTSIVVGFEFSENGTGSGYSTTLFRVTDISGPGIALGPVSGPTTEDGGTAQFTVVLNEQPNSDVVLNVTSTDISQVTVSPAVLTFTSGNWDQTQLVTATGQDDNLADGEVDVTINVEVNNLMSDGVYHDLSASTIITNLDNELPILVINEIFADPANDLSGDANGDGTRDSAEDEFIELNNTTGATLDIAGFVLKEGSTNRHVFPDGTIIPPDGSIVIFGGGTVSNFTNVGGIVQVASEGNLSLNNSGDTVSITDNSDKTIDTYTYASEADNDQSIVRSPDFSGAFVEHTSIGSNAVNFSPGKDNTDNTPFIKTWIGATDNALTTSTNWLEDDVPGTTDNVIIPNRTSTANYPVDGGAIQLIDLIIESGASFELRPTSATPLAILNITGNVYNDGNIILGSNEFGTAQFDEFSGAISGSGNVTAERYMSANRAFRFVSSPVGGIQTIREAWQEDASTASLDPNSGYGTHITGEQGTVGNVNVTSGLDETITGNHSMFMFNIPNQNYDNVTSTNVPLNAGVPYSLFVRGNRSIDLTDDAAEGSTTLRAIGSLLTGPQSTGVNNIPALSSTSGHYSLVPNPYQAIVDLCEVTRTNLNDSFWARSVTGSTGDWLELDLSSGGGLCAQTPVPGPGTDDSRFLPPGIAFFVKTASDAAASMTFNEDDKATDNAALTTVFSQTDMFYINSRLYLTAELQNGIVERDAFGLRFDNQFTTLGDSSEDIDKFVNTGESIAVINNGLRAIDKQNMPSLGDVVQLNTTGYTGTQYSLLFMMQNVPSGMGVFVNDAYLGTQIEIINDFIYNFSIDANIPQSIDESRFSLVFNNTTLGAADNRFGADFRLYPNPSHDGNFSIATPGLSGQVEVTMTDMLGKTVYVRPYDVVGHTINMDASRLNAGIYVINLTQDNKTYTTKVIIE